LAWGWSPLLVRFFPLCLFEPALLSSLIRFLFGLGAFFAQFFRRQAQGLFLWFSLTALLLQSKMVGLHVMASLSSLGCPVPHSSASPNYSINRTCPGKPGHAGYLKR
jgi:hypothetical protein